MSDLHIYTAALQPATHWVDDTFDPPVLHKAPARRLYWCWCCEMRRRAENAVVQVYYDGLRHWCASGKGCKSPKTIEAKRRRERRNRSRAAKMAWTRRTAARNGSDDANKS